MVSSDCLAGRECAQDPMPSLAKEQTMQNHGPTFGSILYHKIDKQVEINPTALDAAKSCNSFIQGPESDPRVVLAHHIVHAHHVVRVRHVARAHHVRRPLLRGGLGWPPWSMRTMGCSVAVHTRTLALVVYVRWH